MSGWWRTSEHLFGFCSQLSLSVSWLQFGSDSSWFVFSPLFTCKRPRKAPRRARRRDVCRGRSAVRGCAELKSYLRFGSSALSHDLKAVLRNAFTFGSANTARMTAAGRAPLHGTDRSGFCCTSGASAGPAGPFCADALNVWERLVRSDSRSFHLEALRFSWRRFLFPFLHQ